MFYAYIIYTDHCLRLNTLIEDNTCIYVKKW